MKILLHLKFFFFAISYLFSGSAYSSQGEAEFSVHSDNTITINHRAFYSSSWNSCSPTFTYEIIGNRILSKQLLHCEQHPMTQFGTSFWIAIATTTDPIPPGQYVIEYYEATVQHESTVTPSYLLYDTKAGVVISDLKETIPVAVPSLNKISLLILIAFIILTYMLYSRKNIT